MTKRRKSSVPSGARRSVAPACFDLHQARRLAKKSSRHLDRFPDGSGIIDLDDFFSFTKAGLEYLIEHRPLAAIDVASFGFRFLTPEDAQLLARLQARTVILSRLERLDAALAEKLAFADTYIVGLSVAQSLDPQAAQAFMLGQQENDIHLDIPSLDVAVAEVLRKHTLFTCLRIRDEPLSVEVAELLARHAGYSLWLDLDIEPSPEVLCALASNPSMPLQSIGSAERGRSLYSISLPEIRPASPRH